MGKFIAIMLGVLAMIFMVFSCTACSKVPAGNVGIKIYLLGKDKGVDLEVLPVGRYWIGMNEELYLFPIFQQNETWTRNGDEGGPSDQSFTFQTVEGMTVNASLGLAYQLESTNVPLIFQRYRKGIDELSDIVIRNEVRDALNIIAAQFTVEQVYGKGKDELLMKVEKRVKERFAPEGIKILSMSYISALRLPKNVTDALNGKIEATQQAQRVENEVQKARAEAEIMIAKARGEQQSMILKQQTITPMLLDWERVQVQREAIQKWNGVLPTTTFGKDVPLVVPFK